MIKRLIIGMYLTAMAVALGNADSYAQSNTWVTAYYAGWMQGWSNNGHLPAQEIDYTAMTHIIHFSLVPKSDGTLDSGANSITPANSSELLSRAHAAGVKVLISVGGWGSDVGFRAATSPFTRAVFISNLVNFMTSRGYDGVDIDWEVLQSTDALQYVAFIQELRTALNTVTPRPLLTAAVTWQPVILGQVHDRFDQINIMSYDLAGAWPGWVSWHNSPIYDGGVQFPSTGALVPSTDKMVNNFLAVGVPASKLGVGIDFYGYVWSGGSGTSTGGVTAPGQTWVDAPSVQANVPYSTIMDSYYQSQYVRWDGNAKAAYLQIDQTGSANDKFISYDNATTAQEKINYARTKGIGGVIIWELGGGYRPNQPVGQRDVLLQAVKQAYNGSGSPPPPPPPPADTTPPTVALTAPAQGATVSETVTLSASATDNVAVTGVRFTVDGAQVGSEDTSAPYSVAWNTAQVSDGTHTLRAIGRDAAGNQATSEITVTVTNAPPPPPPPTTSALTVYEEALQSPWINTSWSATVTMESGEKAYAGARSIKVAQNAWGALSLHSGAWGASVAIDPAVYQSIEFAIHGGTAGINLGVGFQNDSGASFPRVNYGTVPANQWTVVSIPMSQLNPNSQPVHRVNIQDISGTSRTYYIDRLRFMGSGQQPPPDDPPPADPLPPDNAPALTVYEEALQSPWINTSWSATVTMESGEKAYAGARSIKVAQNAWGALSLHSGPWGASVAIDPNRYDRVELAIHGGTAGVSLGMSFENDAGASFPKVNHGTVPANQWTVVSIPMSQLKSGGQMVHRLNIYDQTGKKRTYFVDNIRFIEASGALAKSTVPSGFSLAPNHPNPFNPSTMIRYELPQAARVTLEVYNILGQRVALLVDRVQQAGAHEALFQSANLASGVYLYRLAAVPVNESGTGAFVDTRKMQLIK